MEVNGYKIASGAYLRLADLSEADLSEADFSEADLSRAYLSGANLSGALNVLYGLRWPVYITHGSIQIGCEIHDIAEWKSFTDNDIAKMDRHGLADWHKYKPILLGLAADLVGKTEKE